MIASSRGFGTRNDKGENSKVWGFIASPPAPPRPASLRPGRLVLLGRRAGLARPGRLVPPEADRQPLAEKLKIDLIMSPIETKRQECEIYSRVCGYLRPVKQWNDGKQEEFLARKMFKIRA